MPRQTTFQRRGCSRQIIMYRHNYAFNQPQFNIAVVTTHWESESITRLWRVRNWTRFSSYKHFTAVECLFSVIMLFAAPWPMYYSLGSLCARRHRYCITT